MAARPIVATAVGEVPTVLDGGRAGVLVPPQDAAALAEALANVLADPTRAGRLGAAAAARAGEVYTLDAMIDRYVSLYAKSLVQTQSPNPQSESLEIVTPEAR